MSSPPLLVASTNPGKTREIKFFLSDLDLQIFSLRDIGFSKTYLEDGSTFLTNAKGKSLFYGKSWEGLTLAEDSGLEIDYLHGKPGVLSARFSGPDATDQKNIEKALFLLGDVPKIKRGARFVCSMVLSRNKMVITEILESVQGKITLEKKGDSGFGYDPIFFYPPLNKTFAELSPEEKNQVSHRGRALKRLKTFLLNYL